MKKTQLLIFPILIALLAYLVIQKPWKYKFDTNKLRQELNKSRPIKAMDSDDKETTDFLSQTGDLSEKEVDIIWKKNLFSEAREEDENSTSSGNQPINTTEYKFELTGIGYYGTTRYAVINFQMPRTRSTRTTQYRGRPVPKTASKSQSMAPRRPGQSNLVKTGEEIGASKDGTPGTGWFLKEIGYGRRRTDIVEQEEQSGSFAIIQKGKEKVTIYLDKNDTGSLKRNDAQAKVEEVKPKKPAETTKKKDEKKKLMPPPPPPLPAGMNLPKSTLEMLKKKRNQKKNFTK